MATEPTVAIAGAGIGGLTLALELHDRGIECVVLEAAPQLESLGVGINLLPHATRNLSRLGLENALAAVAVTTAESAFFNRFGQHIYSEPVGRHAGYTWPQFSIHRGDLQLVLLDAVRERLGADAVRLDHRVVSASQDEDRATVEIRHSDGSTDFTSAAVVVAADGVHSAIRRQFHPQAAQPKYTGYMMWRGVTVWPPFLSGASMVRAGWLATGKMVIYPIRNAVDERGRQLVNWVAECEAPMRDKRDWNTPGLIEDFIGPFEDWHFDWLDVPALIRAADEVLEYPMVDQDPLDHWTEGRITLLGDAAHPMVPRGSNGAAQAILDGGVLAEHLARTDPVTALRRYEEARLPATAQVVLTNRRNPPDAILREVYKRTGDQPFDHIDDVLTRDEIVALSEGYKTIAGFDKEQLAQ
ncbi:2-polyprenyl-6-methoxyphenol hydroxylase-like FAD-dependent oxidoreductase [Actinomadura pelletieri DSM 43383]|uniref:2-polyprenyl-6-methoxyphenol hydroxylase-like FAD-dependent oxidoreductase n=1 Tax=Actinomadura pelletieri DSM 43383 TaxID=1120940 RepID=A0A495QAC1_9ACTN|nr:flavin-dependent oxidoreductase [Actinomadura pelletieri]RKS68256.1 2-polyprenyl-6-methoxyphenol hydroxylase-like FAD-dependent oxidoreductase [Actinomadura pelletieri DSM 43383]